MSKVAREAVIRPDGTLAGVGTAAVDLLVESAGRYRLIEATPGVLMLERIDAPAGKRARVLMSGEVVAKTTVLEMVGSIGNNGWRGELTVLDGTNVRRLGFDQGAMKSAFSDAPNERLGEVMVALGALSADQLARLLFGSGGGRRIGELAVEQGFCDQKQIFDMLHAQAQRIFSSALLVSSGLFTFTLPADDTDAPASTLHIPVQGMLLESVQRIDEMAYFRERIPNGNLRPVPTEAATRGTISESLRPVALLVAGKRSILDIGRELRLDEFAITKSIMQLLQIGWVEVKAQPAFTRDSVDRIVRQLNEILREVRDTVDRHVGTKGSRQMLWTLQTWLRESEAARYFGPSVRLDADLSAEAIFTLIDRMSVERPLEDLHRAAHELVSFAMFCSSPSLPREAERALSKWVNQRLARMRL
jgi:hypothetical protein